MVKLEDTWNRNELDSGRVEEVIKDTKGKFSQNTLSKFFRDQVTGNLLTRILDSGNQPRPGEEVVFSISSSVETYYDNEPSSSKKSKSMVDQRGRVFDRLAMQKTCSSAAKQTGKWLLPSFFFAFSNIFLTLPYNFKASWNISFWKRYNIQYISSA